MTTDNEINDWLGDSAARQSLVEIRADHEVTFDRLRVVVDALPDDVPADPGATPWVEGFSMGEAIISGRYFAHLHEEHEPDVRAWLARTAGGLV